MKNKIFTAMEIEARNLNFKYKSGVDFLEKTKTSSIISIVYVDTLRTLYYDVNDLSEQEKIDFVKSVCFQLMIGCNYNREIIKRDGNIYFIY